MTESYSDKSPAFQAMRSAGLDPNSPDDLETYLATLLEAKDAVARLVIASRLKTLRGDASEPVRNLLQKRGIDSERAPAPSLHEHLRAFGVDPDDLTALKIYLVQIQCLVNDGEKKKEALLQAREAQRDTPEAATTSPASATLLSAALAWLQERLRRRSTAR